MPVHVENLAPAEANSASNLLKQLIRKQVHVREPAPVTDNSENSSTPTKQAKISFSTGRAALTQRKMMPYVRLCSAGYAARVYIVCQILNKIPMTGD